MSETVLKLLAEALRAIRITCPNKDCGVVLEMLLASIPGNFNGYECPVCLPSGADRRAEHVKTFARSLQALAALGDKVAIEIVVDKK